MTMTATKTPKTETPAENFQRWAPPRIEAALKRIGPGCANSARKGSRKRSDGERRRSLPAARARLQADLYLPSGEISDTLIYRIAKDANDDGRPLVLFSETLLSTFRRFAAKMPLLILLPDPLPFSANIPQSGLEC
jgi:hypothetical protein